MINDMVKDFTHIHKETFMMESGTMMNGMVWERIHSRILKLLCLEYGKEEKWKESAK